MAHRTTFTSLWTAVLTALVALLASLGFGGKATPAAASVPAAATTPAAGTRRSAVAARRTWRAMMRGGSLPPTIKQRIRAEAHGKTPSVRRSTTAAAMGAGTDTQQDLARTAAVAAAPSGAARDVLALAA